MSDPTPVCRYCGDYIPSYKAKIELLSGLDEAHMCCMDCYVNLPEVRQAPNNREIQEAMASIEAAINGEVR